VTPRVRVVVARAEASVGPSEDVEPTHLLAAILAERGGLASDVLERHAGNISTSASVGG
jgi:hypothetical protein